MHGLDWDGQNLAGWWLSEKLDGWRAYWDGQRFWTRQGKPLSAPCWFLEGMPIQPLDGELYAGLGTTHNDVARCVLVGSWFGLTFRPFDIPLPGEVAESAIAALSQLAMPRHCRPVSFRRAHSTDECLSAMEDVVARGGEGVMVRRPGSRYEPGKRTEALLKVKPERTSLE